VGWAWLLIVGIAGCGARSGLTDDAGAPAAGEDVGTARDGGAPLDSRAPPPPPPPPPSGCIATDDAGAFRGWVPVFDIDFPYVVAGVESDGGHSCPRVFIRAGDAHDFSGAKLEIEVPFGDDERVPGTYPGTMTVYVPDAELPWMEEVFVDVRRADGLFDTTVPFEEWRVSATVSHHDATTDLEGIVEDARLCRDFPFCI
jgi:hypothetical protein